MVTVIVVFLAELIRIKLLSIWMAWRKRSQRISASLRIAVSTTKSNTMIIMILCIHGIDIKLVVPSMNYLFARFFGFSFEMKSCKFVCCSGFPASDKMICTIYLYCFIWNDIAGSTRDSNRQTSQKYRVMAVLWTRLSLRVNQKKKKNVRTANLWHFIAQFNCDGAV